MPAPSKSHREPCTNSTEKANGKINWCVYYALNKRINQSVLSFTLKELKGIITAKIKHSILKKILLTPKPIRFFC